MRVKTYSGFVRMQKQVICVGAIGYILHILLTAVCWKAARGYAAFLHVCRRGTHCTLLDRN